MKPGPEILPIPTVCPQVWRCLVDVNFPEDLGWKEALLGDMEGRLKKVHLQGDPVFAPAASALASGHSLTRMP